MTRAEKFEEVFGCSMSEIWGLPENQLLDWFDMEYEEEYNPNLKLFKCKCGNRYYAELEPKWDDDFGYHYWIAKCPKCGRKNEVDDCWG